MRPAAVLATGEVLELEGYALQAVDVSEIMAREVPPLPPSSAPASRARRLPPLLGPRGRRPTRPPPPPELRGRRDRRDPLPLRRPGLRDFGRQVNAFLRLSLRGARRRGDRRRLGRAADRRSGPPVLQLDPLRGPRTSCAGMEQVWEEPSDYKSFRYLHVTVRYARSDDPRAHGPEDVALSRSVCGAPLRAPTRPPSRACGRPASVTTDLCTDDAFMDSPFREKRNWLGDGSHALLGAWSVWGDVPVIRRYFDLCSPGRARGRDAARVLPGDRLP